MNILLAPPRTGSHVVRNLLDYHHKNIIKSHYAQLLDGNIIMFDGARKVKIEDLDILYYQHRNILDSSLSLICFENFPNKVGSEKELSAYINSTEGLVDLRNNIIRVVKFSWNVFCTYPGPKRLLLYSTLMENPTAFYSNIQSDWGLSDDEANKFINDVAPSIFEKTKTKKQSAYGCDVKRMLTHNNIQPLRLLSAPTALLLREWLITAKLILHPDFKTIKSLSYKNYDIP